MNLKKALQAFLVTVSCGVLNIAGAQQRPVFIPEDYVAEQAQADFVANGPKLLFSDSPETVYNNGILYRDKVEGDVRLFLHHVNGVAGKKKLAVMLKNTDNLRPVTYKLTRSGVEMPIILPVPTRDAVDTIKAWKDDTAPDSTGFSKITRIVSLNIRTCTRRVRKV